MGLEIEYIEGQTPLEEEEKEGLLIQTITTRNELDEFEQQNIEQAIQWTLSRKIKVDEIFTEDFVKELHRRMYKDVWSWAGKFRMTNKNLGVDRWQIAAALKVTLEDTKYWIENKTYLPNEIAVRLKHRIVSVHCFANGNGRHSRLMADIVIEKIFKMPIFSWGALNLSKESDVRVSYIKAVKAADRGNYNLLLKFARS